MDINTQRIIERIESRLIEINMHKGEFYAEAKITPSAFSLWKSGTNKPSAGKLRGIADVLGVSYFWLINGYEDAPSTADGTGSIDSIIKDLYFHDLDGLIKMRQYLDALIELKKMQEQISNQAGAGTDN